MRFETRARCRCNFEREDVAHCANGCESSVAAAVDMGAGSTPDVHCCVHDVTGCWPSRISTVLSAAVSFFKRPLTRKIRTANRVQMKSPFHITTTLHLRVKNVPESDPCVILFCHFFCHVSSRLHRPDCERSTRILPPVYGYTHCSAVFFRALRCTRTLGTIIC